MNSVLKGAAYVLIHAPDMVIHNGATQTTERIVNPDSDYLKQLPEHLRDFDAAIAYPPNQTYIGAMTPAELGAVEGPWLEAKSPSAKRFGAFGEIMPQEEFLLLMAACDSFDLVLLDQNFIDTHKPAFEKHPLMDESIISRIKPGHDIDTIKSVLEADGEGLYHENKLVGAIKKAHDIDVNLSSHVILENLASKAGSVLSLLNLVKITGIDKKSIDAVIDCSEEAVGDMNQRGGGNLAKACAEIAGMTGATGSDLRAFCAAPIHALIQAAALVKSGTYRNVIVSAGGSTAKLGMNGKDHVKKNLPITEDVMGGFSILISENDGISPEILSEYVGWHKVGSGSAPQAVMTALVADPLEKLGMKLSDIGKYAAEMQNPDVTKPAGAGDVPLANYKMIGALAVMRKEIERGELDNFVTKHGMVGWAPTQGHIPSGAPYCGFARDAIMSGEIDTAMIIGKGSLFLGRMTNLFDGASVVIRKNPGAAPADTVSEKEIKAMIGEAMRDFAKSLLDE
ncbi:MAG: glycine/sarcosine/betaine reductase complex component C subunit beta [Defluviitaleaceae bacterium]|nr:glycine/sarcosine/betaine reductase complex component C subunit beta [Defluviitaleaceae bacterium]